MCLIGERHELPFQPGLCITSKSCGQLPAKLREARVGTGCNKKCLRIRTAHSTVRHVEYGKSRTRRVCISGREVDVDSADLMQHDRVDRERFADYEWGGNWRARGLTAGNGSK